MTYGCVFSLFFKSYEDLSNKEKLEKLKDLDAGDLLTLLRNIEESPREFEKEIIEGVYACLFNKGVICM